MSESKSVIELPKETTIVKKITSWINDNSLIMLPVTAIIITILLIVIAFIFFDINTSNRNGILIIAAITGGIFASSFSNVIQTNVLEAHESKIIGELPLSKILEILEKKEKELKEVSVLASSIN